MKTFYVREQSTGKLIHNPAEVALSFASLANADQESLWVIGCNGANKEIYRECIFLGGGNASIVDSRILFKRLLMKDCSSFILVHNHPGGSTEPSEADKSLTKRIISGAEILGLTFLDHLIIEVKVQEIEKEYNRGIYIGEVG